MAKVYPKLESLLNPCQTTFSANIASPNNGVYCYAILFGEGQDKELFCYIHICRVEALLQPRANFKFLAKYFQGAYKNRGSIAIKILD